MKTDGHVLFVVLWQVRMVYASWTISEQEYYNNTLAWLEQEYSSKKD